MIYLAVTLMVMGAALSLASAGSDKEITVKGEVIDQPCYESGGKRGESHKTCALSCAKRGNQLAVVEDGTNAVYSVTGDYAANKNEKLIPFVAEMVEVKGTVTEKDGKKWLAVSSIKKIDKK
jgi:type 1 fimbria pilin